MGLSPWKQLKSKNISYLTLPLLIVATVVEFVILATGWKYQQTVCLPQGMGVTFFGIGPIGATILAVELLKLPLAIWTASRIGWQKGFMLVVGLPLICLLTFQLVKDMAVYEMGAAMTPASQLLEKAAVEETKIQQLNGELAAIEGKKTDRESKLAEFAAKQAKAKADLEQELKRTDEARTDAISLTDYQTKELSEVEARQGAITRQFDIDAAQISKAIGDLRARRETEQGRASKWNAEEARIENAYKTKFAAYTNKKTAYEKDKADYDNANVLKRQLMREPVDPGVPPEREVNTILKPTLVADLDEQIKAKEAELIAVNNKRRDSVAQVAADARRLREDFDRRSSTKREESDKKREALLAAQTALNVQLATEEKELDQALAVAVQKVDGIRAEVDAARKKAESFYEAREAAIKNTQVHRIATTVEIVRGLLFGERPMSITASAKERGDILTDQISMVRIWVYPVLAFIVAFLPTFMVELGFSTLFKPDKKRPQYRLGFLGRRLHWLYIRAGRQKILRAERLSREVSTAVAVRDRALAEANANLEKVVAEKEAEVQGAREEYMTKLAATTDSLNRAITEKDALRDLQKSEIERQIQMRQNAWSDRITQLRQELDDQRAAAEAERTTLLQEQHQKLMAVTEDCKTQVSQARRLVAEAELAAVESSAKLAHDLKEALHARDTAESQLQQQADMFAVKLTQAQEDAARELEKAVRQEKHRAERQGLEFGRTLRQKEEDLERQLKQREQELVVGFDARLMEEQTKAEQEARRREEEFAQQLETRIRETDARWKQEVQQREDAAQNRLKQRELQLQAQTEARLTEVQTQAEQQLRRRELELERQLDAQLREAGTRLEQELQQKELTAQARLKKREQELNAKAEARDTELLNQAASDLRLREEEWERQTEARARETETRLNHEAQQKEEQFQSKLRQRDQQWQVKLEATRAEAQAQGKQALRRRELEADAKLRELETQLRKEMQQKEEAVQASATQREQDLIAQFNAQAQAQHQAAQAQWEQATEEKVRAAIEPFQALLARNEKERDDAKRSASRAVSQMRDLEKKLMEASSFLSGWKNGKHSNGASVDRDVFEATSDVITAGE